MALSLKFGHCFIMAKIDDAQVQVLKSAEARKKEVEIAAMKIKEATKRANKLKSILYSKFGNQIQLEEN